MNIDQFISVFADLEESRNRIAREIEIEEIKSPLMSREFQEINSHLIEHIESTVNTHARNMCKLFDRKIILALLTEYDRTHTFNEANCDNVHTSFAELFDDITM